MAIHKKLNKVRFKIRGTAIRKLRLRKKGKRIKRGL